MIRLWAVHLATCGLGRVRGDRLSPEERARAAAKPPATRQDFLRARWAIRVLLGGALEQRPERLRVGRGLRGEPLLPDHPGMSTSWSRSGGCLLLALSTAGPVGVDVELLRPVRQPTRVLRVVHPAAAALDGVDRLDGFFTAWTLLEAAVKATGRGLAAGARHVELRGTPLRLGGEWAAHVLRLFTPSGGHLAVALAHPAPSSPVDVALWPELPSPTAGAAA